MAHAFSDEERAFCDAVRRTGGRYVFPLLHVQTIAADDAVSDDAVADDAAADARLARAERALNHAKNKLDSLTPEDARAALERAVLLGKNFRQKIVRQFGAQAVSNAWLKGYELAGRLGVCAFADGRAGERPLRGFFNAELPGAFVSAFNHWAATHGARLDWVASSLYPSEGSTALGDLFGIYRHNPRRWLMGAEMRGDLTRGADVEAVARLAVERLGGPADIYTADGGLDIGDDFLAQEEATAHLLLGQVVAGLLALAPGGNFAVKTFTFFRRFGLSVLEECRHHFAEFAVVKPAASRPANSEVYLVGRGFRGLGPADRARLLGAAYAADGGGEPAPLRPEGELRPGAGRAARAAEQFARRQTEALAGVVCARDAPAEFVRGGAVFAGPVAVRVAREAWLADNPLRPLPPAAALPADTEHPPQRRARRGGGEARPAPPGLEAWVEANGRRLESAAARRDADAATAARALEVVRAFIAERGLVLYGGQAIDYALRLRGGRVYSDDQVPDYDFFSPRNVDDAYLLAGRLVAAGFRHVGAIPGIHARTMRVSTDFVYIADITYAPPAVFDRLPTVDYKNVRVLHPDFQRLDMHLAFCFPFNGPPREDLFHRAAKDLRRLRLIQELYPMGSGTPETDETPETGEAPPALPAEPLAEFPAARAAVHGLVACELFCQAYEELAEVAERSGVRPPPCDGLRALRRGFAARVEADAGACRVWADAGTRLVLATPWPDEVVAAVAGGGPVRRRAPFMDVQPETFAAAGVDVYSTQNRLLAAVRLRPRGSPEAVVVASPQYVLLYLLLAHHRAEGAPERAAALARYVGLLRVLDAGGALLAALNARAREGGGADFARLLAGSPFGLPTETIGDANLDLAYLIHRAKTEAALRRAGVDVAPVGAADKVAPPRFYPDGRDKDRPVPTFDYESSPEYVRDGRELGEP